MKPFHQCAIPHKDVLDGKKDLSEYAASLGDVYNEGEGISDEYLDPKKFFQRTFFTKSFEQIIQNVHGRLKGETTDHMLNIRTPFGGGKTHTLIGLLHKAKEWNARTVVLDGRRLDVNKQTFWGEIEKQLEGKIEKFDGQLPHGANALKNLLQKHEPLLILIDEPMYYIDIARGKKIVDTTLAETTVSWFTELSTAVTEMKKTCVVYSLPQSENEYGRTRESVALYSTLRKITGRVEANISPITDEEIPDVVRRRLFSSTDEEIKDNAEEIITNFADYCERENILPEGITSTQYRKQLEKSYPFLPHVTEVLYKNWGTIEQFQRTRGVLRLLSMVIQDLIERFGNKAPSFISLSDFNLKNPGINGELIRFTESRWQSIIANDITGEHSAAKKVDIANGQYASSNFAERSMTAIFMYSHSNDESITDGATMTDIKRAVCNQDDFPAVIDTVVHKAREKLAFLHENNERYLFKLKGNLTKMISEKIEGLNSEEIEEGKIRLIKEQVKNSEFETYVISQIDNDDKRIKDNTNQKLIIMNKDADAMQKIIENYGETLRINRNTITFVCPLDNEIFTLDKILKEKIALEKLKTELNIDKEQKKQIEDKIDGLKNQIPYNITKCYNSIWSTFSEGGELSILTTNSPHPDVGDTIDTHVYKQLRDFEKIKENLGPKALQEEFLIGDFVETKQIYETLCRTPGKIKIMNETILKTCINKGVYIGDFGYGKLIDGKPVYDIWKGNCPVSIEVGEILINPEKISPPTKESLEGESGSEREEGESGSEREEGESGSETNPPIITKNSLEINTNLPDGQSFRFLDVFPKINNSFKDIQIHIECKDGKISEEKIDEIKRILNSLGAKFDVN